MDIIEIYEKSVLESKIDELEKNLTAIESDLNKLEKSDVEVAAVRQLLDVVKEKLYDARREIQNENYGTASQIIHEIENFMETMRHTLAAGPLEIKILNFVLIGIVLIVIFALSLGKIVFSRRQIKIKERMPKKKGLVEKIEEIFETRTCPKCRTKMQEIYKDGRLIGYRCSRCKYIKYRKRD